jgi:hypothetical protein
MTATALGYKSVSSIKIFVTEKIPAFQAEHSPDVVKRFTFFVKLISAAFWSWQSHCPFRGGEFHHAG